MKKILISKLLCLRLLYAPVVLSTYTVSKWLRRIPTIKLVKSKAIFTLAVIAVGCTPLKNNNAPQFEELAHGIAKVSTTTTAKSSKSPSGNSVTHTGFKIIETTDTVPGKIDLVFGIEFKINSKKYDVIKLDRVWSFPNEIVDSSGNKFKDIRRTDYLKTNTWHWMGYTIEKDYEIVKGNWTLQYFYNGKEIYKKTFYMR
jgi:hypothetical protein